MWTNTREAFDYNSFHLKIRCENYIVSKVLHANLYNVMSSYRCDKVRIINVIEEGPLSDELKRQIITKLERFIKYNYDPLYGWSNESVEDMSFLISSRENTCIWPTDDVCCGSINMGINAKWIPEYKLENDYIKPKKIKFWDYHYECNKLPWKSRYLN
mgnify:CR=1 FL=1|jgi:hypothetical protein